MILYIENPDYATRKLPCVLSSSVMSNSCDSIDLNLPCSSVHGILQGRILEWVAISFSRGYSPPRNWSWVSCIIGRLFTNWGMREASRKLLVLINEISKIAGYKINTQRYAASLYTNKKFFFNYHHIKKNKISRNKATEGCKRPVQWVPYIPTSSVLRA